MKKVLISIATVASLTSFSQESSITVKIPKIDNVYANYKIKRDNNFLPSCSCTLNDALMNDNNTNIDILIHSTQIVLDNGFSIESHVDPTQYVVKYGSIELAKIGEIGGIGLMYLKSQYSTNYSIFQSGDVSANRTYLTPNWDGTIATYDGPRAFTVIQPISNSNSTLQFNGVVVKDGFSNLRALFYAHNDTGKIMLHNAWSNYDAYIVSVSPNMTSDQRYTIPAYGGDLVTKAQGNASQTLTASTSMVIVHGMPFLPSNISFTPTDFLPSGGQWKIGAITPTTFTIDFSLPQTGNFSGSFFCYQ